ncbi:hypothetical protein B0H14DRAFT_3435152 [Mycena olivaceomarginata]|nr:hypothetical protein B0H14DRAFT_3435152 [Mycena olivaceomarginata]
MLSAASLTAIAVLENPRLIPKSKFIVFDAQIYLGSSEPILIMSVHYFNTEKTEFADVGVYSIILEELTPLNYHIFGDIVWLVSLGSPKNFGMCHHAFVYVSGLPNNINTDNSTFEVHMEQYLSANKNPKNVFPLRCLFPNTQHWSKYKPVPGKNKAVSIKGEIPKFCSEARAHC